ncbi:phospholipase A-2-activating protein [Herrania umbratica]|uniref:Phospholipase A-2-activating protein n=1 Tax=Herrania umbratica TaxID=108875 RepID=A0A6J1A7E2_9ROSI|nr:phospholipase A-2-activating protein [Herrania umbratica]
MSSMEIDFKEYQLRCQLRGHKDDVRGICVCGSEGIATSSRDRTVRFWSLDSPDKRKYVSSKILLGHSSFVGPLAWISPDEEFPEGGIVSGGLDTMVFVWDLMTGEKVQSLKGHQLQVTGVLLDDGDIVSSSVDCTLRRWRNGQPVESWEAHKSAIQAVIKLPSGELVSGSTDTTLKLWRGKTSVHTFVGHTDTVRGLAVMPGLGVLSASHDGSIRLWAQSGEVLMEMVGHTSIVYSVDSHISGLIVSGSEDRFAKIWKDGVCVQSLEHPGCVWDAKFLVNGDIVTACSDGVIRIWTVDQGNVADTVELEAYASELSQYKLSRKTVGGLKLEDLPGLEALQIPGTSDGQTKIVREGDNGVAYTWNMREQIWDKIGEVVDGPDDSMKRSVLDGVQYDYVFDVDIGDGEPIRKLPYNRSDNPYDTADKWLLKENLPLSYRQQIVEFILQNTGQKDFTIDPTFCDPYTGSSAYVPGQPSYASGISAKPTFKHIPKRGMLVFDAAQFDGILKKISEFNNALLADLEKKDLSLTELEISRLSAIIKILKDTSHYHSSSFADVDIVLLLKLLKSWPLAMIFPVIDIVRMIVLHPGGASILLRHVEVNDVLMEMIKKVTTDPALPANLLTSIRAITNLFKDSCYYGWLQKNRSEILDAFSFCLASPNKNLQLAYSTLILNYAVLLTEKKDEEGQSHVLSAALEIAEQENLEVDSRFRALVAIGSLMLEGLVKKIAMDLEVENIAKAAKASKEAKIAEIGADIELLTKQR